MWNYRFLAGIQLAVSLSVCLGLAYFQMETLATWIGGAALVGLVYGVAMIIWLGTDIVPSYPGWILAACALVGAVNLWITWDLSWLFTLSLVAGIVVNLLDMITSKKKTRREGTLAS